jgi:hypothetical protein
LCISIKGNILLSIQSFLWKKRPRMQNSGVDNNEDNSNFSSQNFLFSDSFGSKKDEKNQLKNKVIKKLWENVIHCYYILPNLRYNSQQDDFYFVSENPIEFLNTNNYEFKLNLYKREDNFNILIRNYDDIYKKYNTEQYRIIYHLCREEYNKGVICIVGFPENLYLNNMELKLLGKCIEKHVLKINNYRTIHFNKLLNENNQYIYQNNLKKSDELNDSNDSNNKENIQLKKFYENENFTNDLEISNKIKQKMDIVNSIKSKPIRL